MIFWTLGALAITLIAGALCFGLWKARALRLRHERVLADRVAAPADSPGASSGTSSGTARGTSTEKIFQSAAALYHGTRFLDGTELLLPEWRAPCVGDVFCTPEGLYLQRETGGPGASALLGWPMAWIEEAALVRAYAPLAGKELPALRLRVVRGGEVLGSELSLKGGMESLEKLRRELHLRQGRGSALEQLRRFVEQAADFGPAPGAAGSPSPAVTVASAEAAEMVETVKTGEKK